MKNIPVYDKTASYARENNELETYRTSKKANTACKRQFQTQYARITITILLIRKQP